METANAAMIIPVDINNLIRETFIVVDNAKRPENSATEAAAQYPLLCRYPKPHVSERRMQRKRSSRLSSRWESAPIKIIHSEYRLHEQTISSCSNYAAMNLVHLTGAMPLRMPVRSRDDFDIQQNCHSMTSTDQSSLIDFLDEALAISEILHIK